MRLFIDIFFLMSNLKLLKKYSKKWQYSHTDFAISFGLVQCTGGSTRSELLRGHTYGVRIHHKDFRQCRALHFLQFLWSFSLCSLKWDAQHKWGLPAEVSIDPTWSLRLLQGVGVTFSPAVVHVEQFTYLCVEGNREHLWWLSPCISLNTAENWHVHCSWQSAHEILPGTNLKRQQKKEDCRHLVHYCAIP